MRILRRFLARLLNLGTTLGTGRAQDERLREEIEGHIALQTQENIRAGLSPVEARRQAILKFGGVEGIKQDYRAKRGLPLVENFLQDVRFAIRGLRRTPGLTAFVVVTLALGIGMTSATFSMVDALIFRPYPVPHPGNIVTLVSTTRDTPFDDFSYREYRDIRDKTTSYDGVIAYTDMEAVGFSAQPGATPQVRGGMMVSGNYFDALGVTPRLGRGFREDEDKVPGRDAVVVLGSDFWRHQFASDPSVVGRTVRLNGKDFTVIGVAPETFPGLLTFGHPDLYVPLAMAPVFSTNLQKNFFEDRDDRELNVKARLKPGTTLEQARSETGGNRKEFRERVCKCEPRPWRCRVHPIPGADDRGRELEIWRGVCDPGAGGAAGGLHQRCWTSSQPCPGASARDCRAIGAGCRAAAAYPAAVDGEPDTGDPRWIGGGRDWIWRD